MYPNDAQHTDFDLLAKHLAGETSPQEQQQVQSWLEASDENREIWEALSQSWQQAAPIPAVDINTAWEKVEARTAGMPAKKSSLTFFFIRAAAVILVLASFSILFLSKGEGQPQWLTATAQDDTLHLRLPDGSQVVLNAHASFSYPERFYGGKRTTRLSGEAFFDVTKDPAQPFSIQAGQTTVQVLGTSFNVRMQEDALEVQVETGLVALQDDSTQNAIQIPAGEGGVWKKSGRKLEKVPASDGNDQFWRTRKLKFNATPLTEVAAQMRKMFGLDLEFGFEGAEKCLFSGKFQGENPEGILEVIATTFNLSIEKDGTKYRLTGSGC